MSANRFIFDAVRDYAETRAEQAALVFDGRITSFAELELRARRVASGLAVPPIPAPYNHADFRHQLPYKRLSVHGCTYIATKSPGAILDNALGVSPKG
jgi:hypothetical protein